MRDVYTAGFQPCRLSLTPEQVARQFKRARAASVKPLLESLSALGQARLIEGGRFAA